MQHLQKTGGGGAAVTLHVQLFSSFHPYLLTSLPLTAIPALPATLFHPWHANVSANIFSPISIGAKRLRAPFAFRRIPPFLARQTINIAGWKSVPVTAR